MIHGISDSLVSIEHSHEIFKNLIKSPCKKLLEVEGEHNDCRDNKDLSIIRDFIMHFSYDPLIMKEHKRRLAIKNLHLNYTEKLGINIDSIINNFKRNVKNDIKREKREMNNFKIKTQKIKEKSDIRSRSDDKKSKYSSKDNILKRSISLAIKENQILKADKKTNIQIKNNSSNKRNSNSIYQNKIDIKNQMLDFSIINLNDLDLNYSFKHNLNHTNRLRSNRNNLLGNILNIETSVKSSQIKFTNIDKSSLKKKSKCDSLMDNSEIVNNK